jgi:uncharacterized protein (DUF2237 family)
MDESINVLGEPLEPCSLKPLTGYHREGSCNPGNQNPALNPVCNYSTQEFLH